MNYPILCDMPVMNYPILYEIPVMNYPTCTRCQWRAALTIWSVTLLHAPPKRMTFRGRRCTMSKRDLRPTPGLHCNRESEVTFIQLRRKVSGGRFHIEEGSLRRLVFIIVFLHMKVFQCVYYFCVDANFALIVPNCRRWLK